MPKSQNYKIYMYEDEKFQRHIATEEDCEAHLARAVTKLDTDDNGLVGHEGGNFHG